MLLALYTPPPMHPFAVFYAVACVLNIVAAMRAKRSGTGKSRVIAWSVLATLFGLLTVKAFFAYPPAGLPVWFKTTLDALARPEIVTLAWLAGLACLLRFRTFFIRTDVAWALANASWLWLGLSLADKNFAAIATDPDNIPIIGLLYLLAGLLWASLRMAVDNDERLKKGEPPAEAVDNQSFFTWPDLVAVEAVAIVAVTCVLLYWSIVVPAPLEAPANPMVTPNPAKAPWYFAGLQELLVYFDPAIAGVVIPLLIIVGLVSIPYVEGKDTPAEKRHSGYYVYESRRFAICGFLFGFVQLWILLIVIGVFFRGPGWEFYGLYADRSVHAAMSSQLTNVTLAEAIWAKLLGMQLPASMLLREAIGIVLLGVYFIALPWMLAGGRLAEARRRLGRWRYWLASFLLLAMAAIPLKMLLHWTLGLSYIINIPEWSLRI